MKGCLSENFQDYYYFTVAKLAARQLKQWPLLQGDKPGQIRELIGIANHLTLLQWRTSKLANSNEGMAFSR